LNLNLNVKTKSPLRYHLWLAIRRVSPRIMFLQSSISLQKPTVSLVSPREMF
jgi:hypothetical protein